MIRGLGLDLVDIEAFRAQLALPGTTFLDGTFTAAEYRESASRPDHDPARHLAVRFAAKEAFLKAWSGAAFGRAPVRTEVDLREIEVVSDGFGRPGIRLHGRVRELVGEARVLVSLCHEGGMAAAVVVME